MTNNIVVGDADSLIALLHNNDSNNERAIETLTKLNREKFTVIYPNTALAEAITTLLRKHSNPHLAGFIAQQYKESKFKIEYINEEIMMTAADLFNPKTSKQNTFFDALVAATSKYLKTKIIFSFDSWYKKQGFTLAFELR